MAIKKPLCNYSGELKELQSGDTLPGGSGSPGGSDTHIQFNDGGSFGGEADLTFNKSTNLLYGAGAFKSNTGEYLTGTTKNFGGFSLASVIFGLNTIGNGLVVNDIAGAKYVLGTGSYNLTFQKHKANTDTWHKSLVLNGDGSDYYPQGISIFTGNNSEKLRLTEPGNLLMGRYTLLPGCVGNTNFKTFLMESPVSSGSSLLALISSNINTSFIGATSGGMVFSLEGTAKNIDFRTGCGFADADPLSSGTLRTRLQGNGYFGIGTGTDTLASMFTVKGKTNPLLSFDFDAPTDNGLISFKRQGITKALFGIYDPNGSSFSDNDFYFSVWDSGGNWHDVAAFANDGSCFKLRNSIPIRFLGSSSGYTGLKAAAVAGSTDFTLPASDGASGNYLKTNGSGVLSWGDPSGFVAGSDTHVQFNDGGSFGGVADLTFNKTTKMLYGAGSFKSNTGEFLTGASGTFGSDGLAKVTFGVSTSGNALVVNDIAGARHALGTGGYHLTFFKHKANTDTWYKSFVILGSAPDNYPQGYSFYTGNNSEKLRLTEPGNLLMGRYTSLPGCVGNTNFKNLLMESPVYGGSSLLTMISSNINTSFIGATSGGMVFSLEGTAKNIDFRTGCGFADADPLLSGTIRMRLQGDGKVGIGTGSDSLNGFFTIKGSMDPLMIINCNNSYNNNVIRFDREGTPRFVLGLYGQTNVFDQNDAYFGIRNDSGVWREIAAFSNDGNYLKLKNTLMFLGSASGHVAIKPPAVSPSVTYTLPSTSGSSGQFLTTDGSANLSWSTPTSSSGGLSIYGNGTDGDVTVTGDTTLTSDMYYDDLTINSGVNLCSNGYKVFVKGTLTLNGKIHNNGSAGSGASGGSGANKATLGSGTVKSGATSSGAMVGQTVSAENYCAGGSGGAGGTGIYNGGAGGSAQAIPSIYGGKSILYSSVQAIMGGLFLAGDVAYKINGGNAGGSGGGDAANRGGGGGGAGGGVLVCAKTITGSGSIEAKGGNGAAGTGGNAGGGGAGGGGFVVVISDSDISSLTINVGGGTGGSGAGSGSAGGNGSVGFISRIRNI